MQEQHFTPLAPALPVVMATTSTNPCAWCLKEQGIPAGEGSHGICAFHHAHMLLQAARRRVARAAPPQGGSVVPGQCKNTPRGGLLFVVLPPKIIKSRKNHIRRGNAESFFTSTTAGGTLSPRV